MIDLYHYLPMTFLCTRLEVVATRWQISERDQAIRIRISSMQTLSLLVQERNRDLINWLVSFSPKDTKYDLGKLIAWRNR